MGASSIDELHGAALGLEDGKLGSTAPTVGDPAKKGRREAEGASDGAIDEWADPAGTPNKPP